MRNLSVFARIRKKKIRTKFGESTFCMVQWNSTVYENFSESENPLTLTSFAVLSIEIQNQTSLKGISASKCDVGNWTFSLGIGYFQNLRNFLRNCLKFFGKFLEFKKIFFFEFLGNFPKTKRNLFGGFFERNFLEEIFLEDFFWEDYFEDFLGGILREKFFVYI